MTVAMTMVIGIAGIIAKTIMERTAMGMMSVAMTGMAARTGIAESRHGRRAATRREQVTAGLARLLYLLMAISGAGVVFASVPDTQSAASLHARYAALGERLDHNQFQQALYLDSTGYANQLEGDLYALVEHPFGAVSAALSRPEQWCEVLILPINTKYCRATFAGPTSVLKVNIGKKYAQPLEDTLPIEFTYHLTSATPNYLEIRLDAERGPMGTSDYRIRLAAVPVAGGRTFLHLNYAYGYGVAGRLAMKAYLATIGGDKVGFTVIGRRTDGQPEYIGGVRGVVERNIMRYYLAIDSYLGALTAPPGSRFERRLQSWFAATEQYPRQLHELDKTDYFDMKRSEYLRQQRFAD